jgi:succinyl-diaminopimelate desuccinylase
VDFVEACRKFISIDSTPTNGNQEIAEVAAEFCRERGLFVETQAEVYSNNPQMNVIARPLQERPAIEFLLQTHLDTPDPGPYGMWTETGHNPFDAHIIDGKIYGLGAADVKLDFLCKLEALASFGQRQDWRLPPVLVGTYGEELGMAGALKIIRKNKISAKMALIGEPSDLQLITMGKGLANVEIRLPFEADEHQYRSEHDLRESTSTQSKIFKGKPAHSSTPHLGESAIKKVFDYLLQLPEGIVVMEIDGGVNFNSVPSHAFLEIDPNSNLEKPMAGKIAKVYKVIQKLEKQFASIVDPEFQPPNPTLCIGLVRTFEDHVFISGCCRISPSVSNEVYETWMRDLKNICNEVGGDFKVTDYKKPWSSDQSSVFIKGCQKEIQSMGISTQFKTQSSTNEASLWSRLGVECIAFGAGKREGNIHTPHEHVAIDDLKKSIQFYKSVIERFCL